MNAKIIERGRGPEIEGTRITVYRIMDFIRDGATPERMAVDLNLSLDQVHLALDYIREHKEEVENGYEKILQRIAKGNPPWVKELRAKSREELWEGLQARKKQGQVSEADDSFIAYRVAEVRPVADR
jgi:uncharacterized protein (DUF433 family)